MKPRGAHVAGAFVAGAAAAAGACAKLHAPAPSAAHPSAITTAERAPRRVLTIGNPHFCPVENDYLFWWKAPANGNRSFTACRMTQM